MRKLLPYLIFLLPFFNFAQHGNEWVDHSADRYYLKTKITSDALYRVDYAALNFALQNAGIATSINDIDPRSVQVFGRGQELYIHVEGEGDGSFDPGDYIEFYAEKNNGWLDEKLYDNAADHTNPFYSLITDTASYFITWRPDGSSSARRITTVPFTSAASAPLPYFIAEQIIPIAANYNRGRDIGSGLASGHYIAGKGWTSGNFGYATDGSLKAFAPRSFITASVYSGTGAPNAQFFSALVGFNRGGGSQNDPSNAHHVKVQMATGTTFSTIKDLVFGSYDYVRDTVNINAAQLNSTNVQFKFESSPNGSLVSTLTDYSVAAYLGFRYPRLPSFSGVGSAYKFLVPANASELFLDGTNWGSSATSFLYDLGLNRRYQVLHNESSGTVKCNIPAGSQRYVFLSTNAAIQSISGTALNAVNGSGKFRNYANVNADSAFLIVTSTKLKTQALEYARYRAEKYDTVLAFVEDLYDQFAYGVQLHPLAIRGFCSYATMAWPSPPKYLLLLGKGIEEAKHRTESTLKKQSLVPTIGSPPADNLLTAGAGANPFAPTIATGRIAALNDADIAVYRNKIQAYENQQNDFVNAYTIDEKLWQKNILLFAGGNNSSENSSFRSQLKDYASILEGAQFAGRSHLFSKTTGSVIEQFELDTLDVLLREGSSIMFFFGHAASNGFDLSVKPPNEWSNASRYPVVIANSCFSGNIHAYVENNTRGISEEYVFTPDEGSIAFLATPDASLSSSLYTFTNELSSEIGQTNYGKSLGEQVKFAAATVTSSAGTSDAGEQIIAVALSMTLHGDPAIHINPHAKSELTINDPMRGVDVSIEPSAITTELDSFDVIVHITNLGKSASDPFSVSVIRSFPNGANDEVTSTTVQGLNYDKTVRLRLPVRAEDAVGENELNIDVDLPASAISEFDDVQNNTVEQLIVEVINSDISPVYPYDFAVVPSFNVTLKANTANPFNPETTYLFQIDTTDQYNSTFMQQHTVNQSGAVVEWNPSLATFGFEDSTVFFWRVTPTSDTSKWKELSFQVIADRTGWGQDHFFQFKNNSFDFIDYNRAERTMSFDEAKRELRVTVVGNPNLSNTTQVYANGYTLDGMYAPFGEWGVAANGTPSMLIAVIDTINIKPWGTYGVENGFLINQDHQFGNANNYNPNGTSRERRVNYFFAFNVTNATQMLAMKNMIENEVPNGYYILAYSSVNAQFQNTAYWDNIYPTFENLGADSIRYVPNANPYIFFGRKGYPAMTREVIGKSSTDKITLTETIYSNLKRGEITGPLFGPAAQWHELIGMVNEKSSVDTTRIRAMAHAAAGTISEAANIYGNESIDLNTLNADSVLGLNLVYHAEDNTNGTLAPLASWHVLYDPAPDAAINPFKGTTWSGNKIVSGLDLAFGVAAENISEYDFDSLRVHYWLTDGAGETKSQRWKYYGALDGGSVINDSVHFKTLGLSGRFTCFMEVNPLDENWQKEQYHFNNKAQRTVEISADKNNPILDVTFDGVHILNGDIVSPVPTIVMELKDDNEFLLMNDTSSFDVYLTAPGSAQRRIPFIANGREIMRFESATSKQNKARVIYQPVALADGTYQLNVIGRDASGNASGREAYAVDFEVVNKSMITNVMNYPNPFTTSTRFVFTLTGSKVPEIFTIQILTVSGKVVREITRSELGTINIGRNVSEYAWDGTDEYGDRLANGVYLYRVIMKIGGQDIERLTSDADQYFTKEFGKMYLFR